MPANLRLGQRLFYTANSAAFPITQQLLGRLLDLPPRGRHRRGDLALLRRPARHAVERAAARSTPASCCARRCATASPTTTRPSRSSRAASYHRTDADAAADLQALADFVNYAIPFPQNPNRAADGTLTAAQTRGKELFQQRCASCHTGDVPHRQRRRQPDARSRRRRSCSTTSAPASPAATSPISRRPTRSSARCTRACDFDTPTLRGVFATAPYFHDGSAATLRDVVDRLPFTQTLSSDADRDALVAYVKTL